jgi:xanthine dehydrogenase molybdopterin binding subunit
MKPEPFHIAGPLHVTGRSRFVVDEPRPEGLCFLKFFVSPFARARILKLDAAEAERSPGVLGVFTHRDIPGENQIGHAVLDEPLLPVEETAYIGQPLAVVAGETEEAAERAVKLIKARFQELEPVLEIEEALSKKLFYAPERKIERGNVDRGFQESAHVIEGTVETGSQEHLYLETQACRAVPGEDQEIILYSTTQSTAEVQEIAARVLGLESKDITVDVRRLGGAFGGKERAATIWACLAALACYKLKKPVEISLARHEDMSWTGKRHPYLIKYKAGFDRTGKILAYSVELNSNGGAYTDLSMAILERSMLHADNGYYIPNVRIVGRACRTNLPPNTAFRGFGAPQGIFAIEHIVERIARKLGIDPIEVRKRNAYIEGQQTPYGQAVHEAAVLGMLERLDRKTKYQELRKKVEEFNAKNRDLKRGIGVVPVKFGISFTSAFLNQGSALVLVYSDGTVSLSHGGVEMGQEVNTKVALVVARELGVKLESIRVETSNTKRTANASPTAASTGSDINGHAARDATRQIKERLAPVAAGMLSKKSNSGYDASELAFEDGRIFSKSHPDVYLTFQELAHQAYMDRVDLCAHGFYATPGVHFDRAAGKGKPFHYYVFGCCLAVAEVDVLTGSNRLIEVHITHETAKSLNPRIDRGQIEGAFVQGYGWCTMEEITHDHKGRYLALTPSTYKIPTIRDLPEVFEVEMVEAERKHASVFGSKAVGEPPFIYGMAAWFAIKDAVESLSGHRKEADLSHPATPEAVLAAAEGMKP